jgi:hypothetical protein
MYCPSMVNAKTEPLKHRSGTTTSGRKVPGICSTSSRMPALVIHAPRPSVRNGSSRQIPIATSHHPKKGTNHDGSNAQSVVRPTRSAAGLSDAAFKPPNQMKTTPSPTRSIDKAEDASQVVMDWGQARLTPEQGLDLLTRSPLHELGRHADARCRGIHGDTFRTYVIDRNINYTNVCTAKCIFCAFKRDAADHDAYTLEHEQLYQKIAELSAIGGTQILMQGGMNPDLPLDWYLDLLAGIKEASPHITCPRLQPARDDRVRHFFNPPGKRPSRRPAGCWRS